MTFEIDFKMTPLTQEFLHCPAEGVIGDCQRATIASLLDLPLDQVPHFGAIAQGDSDVFFTEIQKFVEQHGFVYVTTNNFVMLGEHHADVWHEIAGPSPRDPSVMHAVVGLNGSIAHDPHPSRAGLVGDASSWQFSFLIPKA